MASYDDKKGLELLTSIGVNLNRDGTIEFALHPSQITSKLQKLTDKFTDEELQKAIHTICNNLSNPEVLNKWLTPPKNSLISFVKILIGNKKFQTSVIETLCQYISLTDIEVSMDAPRKNVNLILESMKFHSKIYEPEKVTNAIIDAINNANAKFQPLIISSLHLILDASPEILKGLNDLMIEKPSLTKDILECFENFQFSDEEKTTIRENVMKNSLAAVNPSELNVVLEYLIKTADKNNSQTTVQAFRENLVISSVSEHDDTDLSFIITLNNNLTQNPEFTNAYIKEILDTLELETIDIWFLFCLYRIIGRRPETHNLITKLVHSKAINEDTIENAIKGHGTAISNISSSITDIISWMLDSTSNEILDAGNLIAMSTFAEIQSLEVQQDILASILQQIGIGGDINKSNAVNLLNKMSLKYPEKLQFHSHMLDALLYSFMQMPLSIFKIAVSVVVRLAFTDQQSIIANAGSQLLVYIGKLVGSFSKESKYGIIAAAAVLKRYAEICTEDTTPIQDHFSKVIEKASNIQSNISLLYQELEDDRPDVPALNQLLYNRLKEHLESILTPTHDEEIEKFGIGEDWDRAVMLNEAAMTTISTQSTQTPIRSSNLPNSVYLFSHGALGLFLSCADSVEGETYDVLKLPLHLFKLTEHENVLKELEILYMAHNWIMDLINHYASKKEEVIYERIDHLIEIDDLLLSAYSEKLDLSKLTNNVPVIPKVESIAKKSNTKEDKSAFFINELQCYFITPNIDFAKLMLGIHLPLDDNKYRQLLRCLNAYSTLIEPKKKKKDGAEAIEYPFKLKSIEVPPMEVVQWLTNTLLPYLIKSDHRKAESVTIQVLEVLSNQFVLPCYRNNEQFYSDLLSTVSGNRNRKKTFKFFDGMISEEMPVIVKCGFVKLMRTILHSGPSVRIDKQGEEVNVLNTRCREILQTDDKTLDSKIVKQILNIFFEHNPQLNDDVNVFANDVLCPEVYKGDKVNEEWPTINSKTAIYFFQQTFSVINKNLEEIASRVSKKGVHLDEQNILAVMNELDELAKSTKALLMTTTSNGLQPNIHRDAVKYGNQWISTSMTLFEFFKDAFQVESDLVRGYEGYIKFVRRVLNSKIGFIREISAQKKDKAMMALIPPVQKTMMAVVLKMKQLITETEGSEHLRIDAMKDLDLTGIEIENAQ